MPDVAPDTTLDATLDQVALSNEAHLCTAVPANQAGIAAVAIGAIALTPGDGNGDWTIQDGGGPWSADSGVTVGAATAGTNSLTLSGLTASQTDHIKEGAVFLIAGDAQPYTVQATVSSDGSGDATVTVEPELQVTTAGGEAVTNISGRELLISEQTPISITTDGDVVCIAFDDDTTLHYVKETTSQAYTTGNEATIPAGVILRIPDPAAA